MFYTSKVLVFCFFLPTSKTNFAPLVAISFPWRMCALRQLAFCMFTFLPSLRRRDCLTHLFIFVSPTNHTFPDTQESSNGTLNAWTNGVLIGEATGPGLKWFPWVAWPGVHSCQHFNGWLGLNILAHFHQTTCTFCTAVRVLQCFTNERCCKYLAHNTSWLIQPRAGIWLSLSRCGFFQKQIILSYWLWHFKEREREESEDDFWGLLCEHLRGGDT